MATGMGQGVPQPAQVRLAAEGALVWHDWDDGCVVFNRATGETHFLNLWTSYLLRLIEQGPTDAAVLADRIADDLAAERDEAVATRVSKTLQNFESMALVELCPAG